MKRIKILFTISNFNTAGSGKVVYDLVKGLDKTKFEPEICCFHNKGIFFKEVESLGIKIHVFPFATSYKPYFTFPLRVFRISRFFKKHKFDIIHSWHWSSDFSEPLAAKLAGIPFVYTKKAMSWGNKAWVWRSKLSSKIICINNDMVTQFFSTMHKKISEIPLGVDTNYFKPVAKTYKSPEGIKINKDDFVIISVANLVPVKGIEILLNAVKYINNKSIKVFVIGDNTNSYGQNLKNTFCENHIYFIDKKNDIRPYLALAELFVIPTKEKGEGLPIAPIEAMAMGKIVIGSKVSGITDVLKEFPNHLFDAENINELMNKILQFKNMSEEDHSILINKMRNYVVDNLSLKKFISNHENFYINLVK